MSNQDIKISVCSCFKGFGDALDYGIASTFSGIASVFTSIAAVLLPSLPLLPFLLPLLPFHCHRFRFHCNYCCLTAIAAVFTATTVCNCGFFSPNGVASPKGFCTAVVLRCRCNCSALPLLFQHAANVLLFGNSKNSLCFMTAAGGTRRIIRK